LSVNAPFGGQPYSVSLPELAGRIPFELRQGELDRVDPDQHVVHLRDGDRLAYDMLVLCTGAIGRQAFPGAITFGGPKDAAALTEALDSAAQVAFVAPSDSAWTLPVYDWR
jgi:NADH dehydrogenase FAD-containing subunit